MTIASKTAILFLAVAILPLITVKKHVLEKESGSQIEKSIVVRIEKIDGRLTHEVNSKPIKDPLWALAELVKLRGEDSPVIVILPWDATLREESNERVIASKAGFKIIRSFAYDPDRGFMSEIKWGPSIPFTMNPPIDTQQQQP